MLVGEDKSDMEDHREVSFPCLLTRQPVGDFFVGVMPASVICDIANFDVRRVIQETRDVERYLGIQRPLNDKRVEELGEYVNFVDACFPTSIVLAVPGKCARYNQRAREMTLANSIADTEENSVLFRNIARVIDGQHRIAGLLNYKGEEFEVSVTILVDFDIAEQAHIFSTVNLSQTKVSKSLAYDLFELAKSRSPQKTCHNVAVALDQSVGGPFYRRIKRLGVATEGRLGETVTQATFVEAVLRYITFDARTDRDLLLRGKKLDTVDYETLERLPLRQMFIDHRDVDIALLVENYFVAVRKRWPEAWNFGGRGLILNKTNGFRALMRIFRLAYLELAAPGEVVTVDEFSRVFARSILKDEEFHVDTFKPGTSGEAQLFRALEADLRLVP